MYIVLFGQLNKKDGEYVKNQGPGGSIPSSKYEGGERSSAGNMSNYGLGN